MKNIETLLGKIDTALAMKQINAIVKGSNRKKIDGRATTRLFKSLIENLMAGNRWVTLFDVHDMLKVVQEWHGGHIQTLQSMEEINNTILHLQFERSEMDVVLTLNGEFCIKKMDVLWWHNGLLKSDTTYVTENNQWVRTDFCLKVV